LVTSENSDTQDVREAVEQCVIDKEGAAMDDNAVKDHEVGGPTEHTHSTHSVENVISAKDQEKKVEQHAINDSEIIEDDDAVEDQGMVGQGVVYRKSLTIDNNDSAEGHKVVEQSIIEGMPASTDIAVEDQKKVMEQCAVHEPRETKDEYPVKDDSVEDHKVAEQSIIEGMPASTDDIAVEDQKKVVEQCAVHKPRATEDEYTVKEKEKVVEQGVIDRQGATDIDVAVKDQDNLMKQHIIDNQGTVPMDYIVVKGHGKAAAQYASDAIITYRDDDPAEEHNRVRNQGVSEENCRTKDDIDVEENNYVKEQIIVDNWGTFSDATALEDQKNEAELCKGDEQIAGKDMYAVHMKGGMLEQRTGGNQGATKSDFTVEKHKDVVERVCHEWGAPDDDLAMDTAASQSVREISSSEVVSATANGGKKEKVNLPIRYPQRPRKLNCPFYMSNGSCSYGFSCQFHHPQVNFGLLTIISYIIL
jgi:CRISPR/Cas system-associated protein Cas5 (RAMP superfamily)